MEIGVAVTGTENTYGPIMVSVVEVDSNFFRKFPIKPGKLTDKDADDIFKKTNAKGVNGNWVPITPIAINQAKDMKFLQVQNILAALNTVPKFWEHNIHIICSEEVSLVFEEHFELALPHNLRAMKDKLNLVKWDIEEKPISRILTLAKAYAIVGLNIELDQIKQVWDVNNLPEDCPHKRKDGRK